MPLLLLWHYYSYNTITGIILLLVITSKCKCTHNRYNLYLSKHNSCYSFSNIHQWLVYDHKTHARWIFLVLTKSVPGAFSQVVLHQICFFFFFLNQRIVSCERLTARKLSRACLYILMFFFNLHFNCLLTYIQILPVLSEYYPINRISISITLDQTFYCCPCL